MNNQKPNLEGLCPGLHGRTTFIHSSTIYGISLYKCQDPHCQMIYSERDLERYNEKDIESEVEEILRDMPETD